jgi:hypothetical protein
LGGGFVSDVPGPDRAVFFPFSTEHELTGVYKQ